MLSSPLLSTLNPCLLLLITQGLDRLSEALDAFKKARSLDFGNTALEEIIDDLECKLKLEKPGKVV